jgi:predicted nucleic acid-binding protein
LIFVDTSFWVALRNPRDGHHVAARKLLEAHADSRLVTSNHVRGETWTFVRRRRGHHAACSLLSALDTSPRLDVVRVSASEEDEALSWLRVHDEREYSFVDSTSFTVMRRRHFTHVLAFDGDFSAAGFVELRP